MKQKAPMAISAAALCFLASCAAAQLSQSSSSRLSVSILGQVEIGASKEQVQNRLGMPDRIIDLSKIPDSDAQHEVWEYDEQGLRRLSASFDRKTRKLAFLLFQIRKGDEEQVLKSALSRFPSAKWETETPKWINAHAFPEECRYVENTAGISIEYLRNQKKVDFITKWDPAREIATENLPRPKYCIGEKCVPAMSSEEWVKNSPPCEIPR